MDKNRLSTLKRADLSIGDLRCGQGLHVACGAWRDRQVGRRDSRFRGVVRPPGRSTPLAGDRRCLTEPAALSMEARRCSLVFAAPGGVRGTRERRERLTRVNWFWH